MSISTYRDKFQRTLSGSPSSPFSRRNARKAQLSSRAPHIPREIRRARRVHSRWTRGETPRRALRPGERCWIKLKNRDYWRYEMEREGALNP